MGTHSSPLRHIGLSTLPRRAGGWPQAQATSSSIPQGPPGVGRTQHRPGTSVLGSPTGAHSPRRPTELSAPPMSLPTWGGSALVLGAGKRRGRSTPGRHPRCRRAPRTQSPGSPVAFSSVAARAGGWGNEPQGKAHSAVPSPLRPSPGPSKFSPGRDAISRSRSQQVSGVPGYLGPRPRLSATGFRGSPMGGPLTPAPSGGTGLYAPVVLSSLALSGAPVDSPLLLAEPRSGDAACIRSAARPQTVPGPLTGTEFLRLFGYRAVAGGRSFGLFRVVPQNIIGLSFPGG
ncbi:hypothetical protein NDU88_006071 [Pleurodeles waltl]|uniref:Uncharacterized protein n=1 Tax=Pleurodeles waltl TaxID=8319 RepID=A0AAV7WWJ0_PLEWA|nr:hypothetical protein NDU88_006071 [Pleurodeles waltl]